MATNYTTLKLTEAQVQALFYAINVTTAGLADYDEDEWEEYGHDLKVKAYDNIIAKLQKAGWE